MSIFEKFELEDKIFAGFLIAALVGLLIFAAGFKHIPSPVYGGDFYMIRGFTQAILQGNPIYEDPYFKGEYAYYGWLSYLVAAGLVKLTGIGLEKMLIFLPVFLMAGCLYAAYLFGSAIFKSKRYGLLFAFAFFALKIVEFKISAAMCAMLMLFCLHSLIRFLRGERKQKYLIGLFMGLTALTHISYFIGLFALVLFSVTMEFLLGFVKKPDLGKVWGFAKNYVPIFAIAFVLSLPLTGPWLFKYHMQTLNPTNQYGYRDIDTMGINWVATTFFNFFVRLNGILPFIWGMVIILGVVFAVMNRKNLEHRLALWWIIGTVILTGHFLITRPLLHNWIIPSQMFGVVIWISDFVLVVYGLKSIELILKSFKVPSNASVGIASLFLGLLMISTITAINADKWINYGRELTPDMQVMFDTEAWMLANTNNNDVFLGNDESSFALNAMTGRKLVIARRTHASYYVDVEDRYADAVVMLYGNDLDTVKQLVRKYGVTYFYLDSFLMNYPLIVNLKYQHYLDQNGINYTIQDVRLDPASADSKLFRSLVVLPEQPRLLDWNITTPAMQFTMEGKPYSYFFKVEV
jgi:hypothetical protein